MSDTSRAWKHEHFLTRRCNANPVQTAYIEPRLLRISSNASWHIQSSGLLAVLANLQESHPGPKSQEQHRLVATGYGYSTSNSGLQENQGCEAATASPASFEALSRLIS
jgi:hypothetical protein